METSTNIPEGVECERSTPAARKCNRSVSSESVSMDGCVEKVYLLRRSLYGLKQAPRCWNVRFKKFLDRFKFKETCADKCVFIGKWGDKTVILGLFVDDGLLCSESVEAIQAVLDLLSTEFEITVSDASRFIGLDIARDRSTKSLFISQKIYTRNVIEKFGMSGAKSVSVPADPSTILYPVENDEKCLNDVPYREAVGSLMYLATCSRPDLAYAVHSVIKYLKRHSKCHWNAVKRISAYLVGTACAISECMPRRVLCM